VTLETNAKKVKDFALEPIRTGPHGLKGIEDGLLTTDSSAQANALAQGDGYELVIQFEAWLDRETVDAGGVAQKIELQLGAFLAKLGNFAKLIFGNDDGGGAAMFNDLCNRGRPPGAKLFDYNISVRADKLRHVTVILKRLRWSYFWDLCQSRAPFFQR
jgi:hypothetical protein